MLAGAAFRDAPFHSIDRQVYQAVIQPNDPISSIWVTKIYANHFLSILKSGHYSERHGNITTDMLSEFLNHPNEIVRKYAMWAFAQEEGIGFESILPYVRLENAFSMESGKLKWTALASAQIQNKPDGSTRVGAIPEYALLWPIPLDEIQANPALEGHQNPGWN